MVLSVVAEQRTIYDFAEITFEMIYDFSDLNIINKKI